MRQRSRSIGLSAASTLLLAVMPKCPLCWIALMSTIGVTWPVSSGWLRSFVVAFALVPLGLLLLYAYQSHDYRPFILGLIAATALYVFKFGLALDAGMYLSGATLFGATLWSAKLSSQQSNEPRCFWSAVTCHGFNPPRIVADNATSICKDKSAQAKEVRGRCTPNGGLRWLV